MRFLRSPKWNIALTLVLVPILAVAGISMAVARGQPPAVGQVVICSGYGFVTIALDVDGHPTEAIHPCPDCVPAQSALPGSTLAAVHRIPIEQRAKFPARELVRGAQPARVPPARGPPHRS